MEEPEFILCAALNFEDIIICGHRHSDCYAILEKLHKKFTGCENDAILPERENRGFLTSHNRYVSRKEAWDIAKTNNQIAYGRESSDEYLISENLY
jgi:hypothetical protein